MDVTSMLNTNSSAVEQPRNQENGKEDISRTPTKSRTPWDAGGYSLPLNTVSSPSTPPHGSQYDDIHTFTPTSPRHKFSDSRSSLSSFTSSLQSTTHSRFSSLSTVGSSQPLNSLSENLCENLSPRSSVPRSQSLELSAVPELYRPSVSRTHSRGSLSPTDSLAALSIGTKEALLRRQSETIPHIVGGSPMSAIMEKDAGSITPPEERPCSPSDAILIRRPTLPSLRVLTSEQELNGPSQALLNRHFLSAPLENNHHNNAHGKGHKRALSAPDLPASAINYTFPMAKPPGEPTPPASHHPDDASPVVMSDEPPAADTPPADVTSSDPTEIKCMYIQDCNTGSQLRKAISHIFGRNKMCTRLIPDHVWVHFCRKHYQRSRYRNPKNYAQLQCELVQKQIRRVHEWSHTNELSGNGGVVKDWTLSMRKREQKRIDDLASGKKRSATTMDEEYDSEGYEQMQPGNLPPTAVPQWLINKCRSGYSTFEISELFNELHRQVAEEKNYLQFPDIELLPNIIGHVEQPKASKGHARRASAGGQTSAHKRTQSLGVTIKPEYQLYDRRSSQSSVYGTEPSNTASGSGPDSSSFAPAQKRRRPNETFEGHPEQANLIASRPRIPEMGRRMQVPHRPSPMAYIPEHQVGELNNYSLSPQQYQAPLAAPSPQRFNGQSMASRLETGNSYPVGRSGHVRSRSDLGAIRRRLSPSQVFNEGRGEYPLPRIDDGEHMRPFYHAERRESWCPTPQQQSFGPNQTREMLPIMPRGNENLPTLGHGHQRNHSTPMVPSSYVATNYALRATNDAASGSVSHNPHMTEDEHARALYSARR